jgi:hypothetical protein
MCDYSLMMIPNRLAVCGEELVAHKFRTGSVGFVGRPDYECWRQQSRATGFWERVKYYLVDPPEPAPVVCMPPGVRVRLFAIGDALQQEYSIGSCDEAVVNQLSPQEGRHRDVFCFENGAVVSLQALSEEQRLKVLWLSSESQEFAVEGRALQRVG